MPRIIVFNESFVPVGKAKCTKRLAVLWHEGVAKRNKEEIISAFYTFFRKNRDVEHITIWLDNCSAQNKNWALFSFFVYIVNCSKTFIHVSGPLSPEGRNVYEEPKIFLISMTSYLVLQLPMAVILTLLAWTLGSFTTGMILVPNSNLKRVKLVFAIFQEITLTLNTKQHLNMKSISS
nr:unnamed protein product [Callosobruchus analis]